MNSEETWSESKWWGLMDWRKANVLEKLLARKSWGNELVERSMGKELAMRWMAREKGKKCWDWMLAMSWDEKWLASAKAERSLD